MHVNERVDLTVEEMGSGLRFQFTDALLVSIEEKPEPEPEPDRRFLGGMLWLQRVEKSGSFFVRFRNKNFLDTPVLSVPFSKWHEMGRPDSIGMSYGIPEYFEVGE